MHARSRGHDGTLLACHILFHRLERVFAGINLRKSVAWFELLFFFKGSVYIVGLSGVVGHAILRT